MKLKRLIFMVSAILMLSTAGYIIFINPDDPEDIALFKWINSETSYTYFKNDTAILATSEETERAHDNFMRVRFNQKALSVLDENYRLPDGLNFPDSSIIVKEIYSEKNNSSPDILAVMVKLKEDNNAGNGWLWAEYTPSGETEYSVTKKGKICIKCHKPGDDYVRILEIFKK